MHSHIFPLLFSLASASQSLTTRQDPIGACSTRLHVIAVGGANYTNPYDLGRLTPTAQSIVARIPGSDYVSVPYEKLDIRHNPKAVPGGITNLVEYVNGYHAKCPEGKIALVGYSSGAVITMDAICEGYIDSGLAGNTIIATIAYGDQTRVPGLPYDKGTCVSGSGKLSSKRDPAGCAAFADSIQSYCDINDPECCDGPPEDYQIHFVYPGEYDGVVAEYVASKFKEAGGSTIETMASPSLALPLVASLSALASSSASAYAMSSAAGDAVIATMAANATMMGNATMMASMTAPVSDSTTTPVAVGTSGASVPDSLTFTPNSPSGPTSSTLTASDPNGAFAISTPSALLWVALAATSLLYAFIS